MLEVSTVELAVLLDSMAERAGHDLSDAALMAAAERELVGAGVQEARERLLAAVLASPAGQEALERHPGREEAAATVLDAQRRRAVAQGLWDGGRAPWALLAI